ncbi:hypothetical protein SLP22_0081 [Salmonella phage BAU.Micro_SLP-22]
MPAVVRAFLCPSIPPLRVPVACPFDTCGVCSPV